MYLSILLLFIAQNAVLISTIIMVRECVAARFMEIFSPTIGWLPWWLWRLLFPPPREQARVGLVFWEIDTVSFDEKVRRKHEGKEYRSYLHGGVLCNCEGMYKKHLRVSLVSRGSICMVRGSNFLLARRHFYPQAMGEELDKGRI